MNNITYKVVSEWSAPTYYDIDTNEELYDECDASIQALWVVSYDTTTHEIIEWLERFYANKEDEAKARAEELNREGENNMEEPTQLDDYKLEVESRYNDYLLQAEHRDISMGEVAYIEGLTKDKLDEFLEDLEEAIKKGEE